MPDPVTIPPEAQTYIGAKVIIAWPSKERQPNVRDPLSQLEPREGYAVQYEDGYLSWSPADVFEAAYRAIPAEDAPLILAAVEDRIEALRNGALIHEALDADEDRRRILEVRFNALRLALDAGNRNSSSMVREAATYTAFILDGAPPPSQGPLTRAEIERRGFDTGEGADETVLGIIAKLGYPTAQNPMGTAPTHMLVPIAPAA